MSRILLQCAMTLLAFLLTLLPLPEVIAAFRPDWVALTLIYWAIAMPGRYGIIIAWLMGIVLDVVQGTLLGQHALALCGLVYLITNFRLLLRSLPLWQLSVAVCVLLSAYQFLLFWINGVVGVSAPAVKYWGPALTGTLFWPALAMTLHALRYRLLTAGR